MAPRSDIRQIGKYMRQRGADGSLVAWVQAELDHVDLDAPRAGCLTSLVEDLTVGERHLIVSALLDLALREATIVASRLDAAIAIARELGIAEATVEVLLRDASGWSMRQARELAALSLPASISPAALEEARSDPSTGEQPIPPDPTAEAFAPLESAMLDLPDLGDASEELTESQHRTERMDHLADVVRAHDAETDDLADDPPTVEMTPEAVQAILRRRAPDPTTATPTAQPLQPSTPQFSDVARAMQDGPATLGLDDSHGDLLAATFDDTLGDTPELMPIDWGETDAFTLNDFTLSEQLEREHFRAEAEETGEEPTQFMRVPPEVTRAIAKAKAKATAASEDYDESPIPPHTAEIPEPDDATEPRSQPLFGLDPDSGEADDAPAALDLDRTFDLDGDLELDDAPAPAAPAPPDATPDVAPTRDRAPQGRLAPVDLPDGRHRVAKLSPQPTVDTGEILLLDLDEAPEDAFDRILGNTGPLPPLPEPVAPLPELSLDPDPSLSENDELSLDPDTGEHIRVAESLRSTWAPPPAGPADTGDLELDIGLPRFDDDSDENRLQPLDEGLAAYWAPHEHVGDGLTGELRTIAPGEPQHGLTGELQAIEPGDLQRPIEDLDLDSEDGLTRDLTPVIEEAQRRARRRGPAREGLTQDLTPIFDAPRQRRRGKSTEGLTQDLTLIVDDED